MFAVSDLRAPETGMSWCGIRAGLFTTSSFPAIGDNMATTPRADGPASRFMTTTTLLAMQHCSDAKDLIAIVFVRSSFAKNLAEPSLLALDSYISTCEKLIGHSTGVSCDDGDSKQQTPQSTARP